MGDISDGDWTYKVSRYDGYSSDRSYRRKRDKADDEIVDEKFAIPDEEMDKLIEMRRKKDNLQDAYIDIFLRQLLLEKKVPTDGYHPGRNVFEMAKKCELFEKMQVLLDENAAGKVDTDIITRLGKRWALLLRGYKRDWPTGVPVTSVTSMKELLERRLSLQKAPLDPPPAVPPLQRYACHEALKSLAGSISEGRNSSLFAVGGKLELTCQEIDRPIRLWWKTFTSDGCLSFPLHGDEQENVHSLVEACVPATFGRDQRDVLDENYRKAGKLDAAEFLTDFCPYKMGIIDEVAALLGAFESEGRIRCEMYNLNIYSSPSGRFRNHVDTPQGAEHFASLVVCFPCYFEGGDLEVRHEGKSASFHWAEHTANIQWAAFYSDCEHEVKEISAGYRLTLTYNLFWTTAEHRNGPKIDPSSLPVSKSLASLLQNPGAVLGVPCSHYYAHNTHSFTTHQPSHLKGSDRALASALDHLKLEKHLSVILSNNENRYGGISIEEYLTQGNFKRSAAAYHKLQRFQRKGYRELRPKYSSALGKKKKRTGLRLCYLGEDEGDSDFLERLDRQRETHDCDFEIFPFKSENLEERITELSNRRVKGYHPEYTKGSDVVVAHQAQPLQLYDDTLEDDSFSNIIDRHYAHTVLPQVLWLHEMSPEDPKGVQMAYMTYGNSWSLDWRYSRLALIFAIPPWSERQNPGSASKSIFPDVSDDEASRKRE